MAQIRVDSDLLLAAVGSTHAAIERVRAENSSLTSNLVNLQTHWTGTASMSFQDVVTRWRGVNLQVEEHIGLINTALGAAGNTYGATEQDVTRLFMGGAR